MPVSRKPATPAPGGGQAAAPGGPAKPGATVAKGKQGAAKKAGQDKGGKRGGAAGPAMARGGSDPFAPGGGAPGAAPPGAPARPGSAGAPMEQPRVLVYAGRRKDPFLIDWKLPVPPPYVFDEIEPIRLASEAVETPLTKPFEVREQPEMRVSGILTGDGVFAILESGGNKVDVVKPGSSVDIFVDGQTKRTYKVVSITKDKVKLRSQVGNVIYTQEVPLSDVAVGTAPRGGGFGGPGGAATPGGMMMGGSAGGSGGPAFGPSGAGTFGPPGRRGGFGKGG